MKLFLPLLLLLTTFTLLAAPLQFDFAAPEGWSKTKGLTFTVEGGAGILDGVDWDSKIYRNIRLTPDTLYEVSGTGRGKLMIHLYAGKQRLSMLNLSGEEWRDNAVRFRTPENQGGVTVYVQVNAAKGHAEIRSLQFVEAVDNPAERVVLDPAKLRANRPNPEVVRGFMMGNFTEKTAKAVREWGANAVRLQYSPVGFGKRQGKSWEEAWPEYLDRIEEQVLLAKANDLKVIIDLHGAPVPKEEGSIWKNPDLEKNFLRVWRDIATRLKPHGDTIWGYDLYNEPLDRDQLPYAPKEWRPLAIKLLRAIREIDPLVWIIFEPGPGGGAGGLKEMDLLPDYRVIYSTHFYSPAEFTHQGIHNITGTDLAKAHEQMGVRYPGLIKVNGREIQYDQAELERRLGAVDSFLAKYPVPYFIGEFSAICWAPEGSGEAWLRDVIDLFEKRGWSWTYHAFAEWQGWSLEYEGCTWENDRPKPTYVGDTGRARLVREFLKRNQIQ